MVLGVIDIGSLSCRLKIVRWDKGHGFPLYEDLATTRLMQGVAETGLLAQATMEATLQALQDFRRQLEAFHTEAFRAVATSAMREARNGAAFAAKIEVQTGIPVEIISGEEEAALSYAGMSASLPSIAKPLLLDVGGGSSEFSCPGVVQKSLKMGAVRATEEGLSSEKAQLLLAELLPYKTQLQTCSLVGCGGTITSIAAIFYQMEIYDRDKVQGTQLSYAEIEKIWRHLASLSVEERRQVPGLQPKRADVIVGGIFWVLQIMQFLQASVLTVSDADLREGILAQLALAMASKQD